MDDGGPNHFETTHWSIVLAAGREVNERRDEALRQLCHRYWMPLYGFVRRRGHQEHDAQDITQGFFQHVLEHGVIESADHRRGRFRTFLLASLKNYLANRQAAQRTLRRGGGRSLESLDLRDAEGQLVHFAGTDASPEHEFDRRWAMALLDRVLQNLQQEYNDGGNEALFAEIRCYLSADSTTKPYREIAEELGQSEANVKVLVHRMRKRYRKLIELEIADTVADPSDIESEIRDLFRALGGGDGSR